MPLFSKSCHKCSSRAFYHLCPKHNPQRSKIGSTLKFWAEPYINGELTPTFSTATSFIDVIKGHFEDPNLLNILSIKLNNLRQRTSVLKHSSANSRTLLPSSVTAERFRARCSTP